MKYWYQKPVTPLNQIVKTILVLENFSAPDILEFPLFPFGMPTLVFQTQKGIIGNKDTGYLTIFSKMDFPNDLSGCDKYSFIAYYFKPYMLGTLFGLGVHEMKDQTINLNSGEKHGYLFWKRNYWLPIPVWKDFIYWIIL